MNIDPVVAFDINEDEYRTLGYHFGPLCISPAIRDHDYRWAVMFRGTVLLWLWRAEL